MDELETFEEGVYRDLEKLVKKAQLEYQLSGVNGVNKMLANYERKNSLPKGLLKQRLWKFIVQRKRKKNVRSVDG